MRGIAGIFFVFIDRRIGHDPTFVVPPLAVKTRANLRAGSVQNRPHIEVSLSVPLRSQVLAPFD
jgi:hypothetical protein